MRLGCTLLPKSSKQSIAGLDGIAVDGSAVGMAGSATPTALDRPQYCQRTWAGNRSDLSVPAHADGAIT